ncbi:MAG: class I SAM-dependent methyltransferase [Candidatus Omnitrophica bacterium]|nr:class I SAM-dependent methyltransferase [Candidatus Omnitrophota bacterium]
MNNIPYISGDTDEAAKERLRLFGLSERSAGDNDSFILETDQGRWQIRSLKDKNFGAVHIDFVSGKVAHRRIFGSPRNEAITRAVGFKKDAIPNILDLTAGLGQDAFVLASVGCRIHMIERCNIIAALLYDGLKRAEKDNEIGQWVRKRLSLSFEDSLNGLKELPFEPDVVYIDAMFPEKKKSALVRKEVQLLREIVGQDFDQDELLEVGRNIAKRRIVVKRPNSAEYLNNEKPNISIKSKNYRFDIYLLT